MSMVALTQDHATQIAAIMIALIAVAAILGALLELRERDRRRMGRRIARHCRNEEIEAPTRGALQRLREEGRAALRPIVNATAASLFAREADRAKARKSLRRAGFAKPEALAALAAVKLVLAVVMAVVVYALLQRVFGGLGALETAFLCLGGGIFGGVAPEIIMSRLGAAREQRLRLALPDAIDLMVISAEAGQSLDMSLDRVAKELPLFAPELSEELRMLNAELQLLSDRAQALRNFAERNEIAEFSAFATALIQSIRYGASFASTLKAMAADLRQARMLRAEEKAAKLPALLTIPLIIFIMPPVFIVVAGPAILALMNAVGG